MSATAAAAVEPPEETVVCEAILKAGEVDRLLRERLDAADADTGVDADAELAESEVDRMWPDWFVAVER